MADSIDIHRVRSITVEPPRKLKNCDTYSCSIMVETERAYFSIALYSDKPEPLSLPCAQSREMKRAAGGALSALRDVAKSQCFENMDAKTKHKVSLAINTLQPVLSKEGIWPASKLPTCPKCGWPPMVDEENATEDDPAPIVCAC